MAESNWQDAYIARNARLKQMGFESYRAYLDSPLWASIRARVWKPGICCVKCSRLAAVVHHSAYDRHTLEGTTLACLHPVCHDCHAAAEWDGLDKRSLRQANVMLGIKTEPPPPRKVPCPACGMLIRHGRHMDNHLLHNCRARTIKPKPMPNLTTTRLCERCRQTMPLGGRFCSVCDPPVYNRSKRSKQRGDDWKLPRWTSHRR